MVVINMATVILRPYAASIASDFLNSHITPIQPANNIQFMLGTYSWPF
jgi:hypothetical protein